MDQKGQFEHNYLFRHGWGIEEPKNYVKQSMKRRVGAINKSKKIATQLKHNSEIRAAYEAAAAVPPTAANIAFANRLARRAAELKALQNSHRAAQNEIRRQRHINASEAARAMLNAEGDNAEVNFNNEVNSRNNFNPIITNLQSRIYALEHANPVNSVELEKVRALLEVTEARQMLERINEELPRLILEYGEDSIDVKVMLDAEQEALERSIDAVARLEALQASGGRRRRTRKHKNRPA